MLGLFKTKQNHINSLQWCVPHFRKNHRVYNFIFYQIIGVLYTYTG